MIFLLLFFDVNNIYSFSGWWYFFALVDTLLGGLLTGISVSK